MPLTRFSSAPAMNGATIRTLLTRIGSNSTGAVNTVLSRLTDEVQISRLPSPNKKQKIRILSIDMGIKNLAFCVADIKPKELSPQSPNPDGLIREPRIKMHIAGWERMDILKYFSNEPSAGSDSVKEESNEETNYFTPSALSKSTYRIVTQKILPYKPDVILIEGQRWRSMGSKSVLQWTIRVNMLESMLWASLEAIRGEARLSDSGDKPKYDVFSVDPSKVMQLNPDWRGMTESRGKLACKDVGDAGAIANSDDEPEKVAIKSTKSTKARKEARIKRLRSWLALDPPSTIEESRSGGGIASMKSKNVNVDLVPVIFPELEFDFSLDAHRVRTALCAAQGNGSSRKERTLKMETAGLVKFDDITDCFLQAATWVAWEKNRLEILKRLEDNVPAVRENVAETSVTENSVPKKKRKKSVTK